MSLKVAVALGLLLVGACAFAAPETGPATNSERAKASLAAIANGPWVVGDWAFKAVVTSGNGRERIAIPMDVIGGWTEREGRWQRVRMANGALWLLKSGNELWELGSTAGLPAKLSGEERLRRIHERVNLSWELYTMGFLNWQSWRYKGVQKVRGRWCDCVELVGEGGIYTRAELWMDTEFGAPLEAELFGQNGELLKTLRAVSLQKVEEGQWVLKRWDVVDEVTHTKVTIEVTAVALGLRWDAALRDEKANLWPEIPLQSWRILQ